MLSSFIKQIIPTVCHCCSAVNEHRIPNLCDSCWQKLPWLSNRCASCAIPLETDNSVCGQCLNSPPSFDRTTAAVCYKAPISSMINRLKHNQDLSCASTLADVFIRNIDESTQRPDVIIPMPLHWRRQFTRGFNQSDCLARCIGKRLSIQVSTKMLRRVKHSAPQQGLNRKQRLKNLDNCFRARAIETDVKIALFDDVITTGATMEIAARALKSAGANNVVAWSIARTPEPG